MVDGDDIEAVCAQGFQRRVDLTPAHGDARWPDRVKQV